MHEHEPTKEYGPALAIVIIITILAIAAFVLYGQIAAVGARDENPLGPSQVPTDSSMIVTESDPLEIDLDSIERDLAELEKFEEEYLDFSDLDDLDLDFNF